jgi:lipopolysaccharide transport protein LptA
VRFVVLSSLATLVVALVLPAAAKAPSRRLAAVNTPQADAPLDCTQTTSDDPKKPKEPRKSGSGTPASGIEADNLNVDYKTNSGVFENIVLCNDMIRVHADHAETKGGLRLENGQWTFKGNVRINTEKGGYLHSDQAVVELKDGLISRATVTGSPAEFEQNSEPVAHGRAEEIVYDVTEGSVKLNGDAHLFYEGNNLDAPLVVYNIRERQAKVSGQPGSDGSSRVHITIPPRSQEPDKKP